MSYSKNRQEYLDKKYAEVEDRPISGKPSQRRPPKKAKHRHEYMNCILRWKPSWFSADKKEETIFSLASYCPICGKIGVYDEKDKFYIDMVNEMYRKSGYRPFLVFNSIPKEYLDKARSLYRTFDVEDIFDKYVSL